MRIAARTIDSGRDPDMGFDCALGSPAEALNAQVLLDPLKRELDLSPRHVSVGDG